MDNWQQKYNELASQYDSLAEQLQKMTKNYAELVQKSAKHKQKVSDLKRMINYLNSSQRLNEALNNTLCYSSFHKPRNTLKNRMFEGFFIVGSESDDCSKILNRFPSNVDDFPILDFVYPQGYQKRSIDLSYSGSSFYEIMYPSYERDQKSFVFCIKSSENASTLGFDGIPNNDKEVLYGCCVIDYILEDPKDGNPVIPIWPICYCIMSHVPCFDVHFQVIYTYLSLKKAASLVSANEIHTEFSSEQKVLLEKYYSRYFLDKRTLKINLSTFKTQLALPEDLSNVDSDWGCPLLFSLLSIDDLFQLIFGLMSERSIIFRSRNLAQISSCVIGLNSLIRPFKWPFVVSPILPESLHVALEAPVPILAGVTSSVEVPSNCICVRLKDHQPLTTQGKVVEPFARDLKEYVRAPYKKLKKVKYSADSEQLNAVRRIANDIRHYWTEIIRKIPPGSSLEKAKTTVLFESDSEDRQFISNFVNTQIFAYMVDNINKSN